jgi:uncharacterized protein (TIGR00725 family)
VSAYVAVVGPGDADAETCAVARSVGELLASAGAVVLTGGLGGVMAAAAAGALSVDGVAVGLLPGTSRADGSAHTVLLPTGLGEMRNGLLVRAADAVIAVGGSWGTLSEIALARRSGVPVVVIGGWSVRDADGSPVDVATVDSAESAVATVLAAIHS